MAIKYYKNISWNCGTERVVVVHIVVVDVAIVVHVECVIVVAVEVVRRQRPNNKRKTKHTIV